MGGASAGGGTPSVQEQTGRDSLSRLGHSIQRAVSSSKVAPGVSLRAGDSKPLFKTSASEPLDSFNQINYIYLDYFSFLCNVLS